MSLTNRQTRINKRVPAVGDGVYGVESDAKFLSAATPAAGIMLQPDPVGSPTDNFLRHRCYGFAVILVQRLHQPQII
jgi:hypothetical protein